MSEVNELVEFDKIAAGIAEIQEKGNFLPDTTTKEGYEASKRFVLDITTPARTKLDKAHKTAKAYWVAGGKKVDGKKKEIMDILVDIQKPHQEAYKAFDQAEKDKKAKFEQDIQNKIDILFNYRIIPNGSTSESITSLIQQCGETDTQNGFYHRATDALNVRQESLDTLNDLLMQCVAYEAEQEQQAKFAEQNRIQQEALEAQQEEMRLQQEEMDRKQREIDEAQNAIAEKARIEAEEKQAIIDKEIRFEREKQEAIEREAYAKEQADIAAESARLTEVKRQQDELKAQQEEQAKLEANKKHTGKVRKEIKEHLIASCGLDNDVAVSVVKALLKTNRVTINY